MSTTTTPPTMARMSVRELRLRLWVKENIVRARTKPRKGLRPLTKVDASIEMKVGESLIGKWEDPEQGGPTGTTLPRVADWIEERLGVKAPR